MKAKLTFLAALLLALGSIAAGCGDDGNDDETDATDTAVEETLSEDEFAQQANEICKQGEAELNQAFEDLQGPPGDGFIRETLIPNVQNQIDEIQALGPSEQVSQTLDEAEQVLADLEADPSKIEGADPFADVNKQLRAEGLTVCGSG